MKQHLLTARRIAITACIGAATLFAMAPKFGRR